MINWQLLSVPANWIIIFLVLYLVAMLARAVHSAALTGVSPFPFPGAN